MQFVLWKILEMQGFALMFRLFFKDIAGKVHLFGHPFPSLEFQDFLLQTMVWSTFRFKVASMFIGWSHSHG